jgi:5-methylcytosine-specific restriction enzyme A
MSRDFSPPVKRAAWGRCGGRCEYMRDGVRCNMPLAAGNRIYDHRISWAICQDSSLGNCQVICCKCDREKTARDQGVIADVRHVRDFHLGITGPGLGRCPLPGGRRDRDGNPGLWCKTFRHGVQPRTTQAERHRALMARLYPGEWR